MSEKHIGEVVQVIGPVLDIRFGHDELPALLNAIEIDHEGIRCGKAFSSGDPVGSEEALCKMIHLDHLHRLTAYDCLC